MLPLQTPDVEHHGLEGSDTQVKRRPNSNEYIYIYIYIYKQFNLVAKDLWHVLLHMHAEGESVLGGPLLKLMPVVQARMSRRGEFGRSEYQMPQLRFARMAVIAQ